MDEPGIKIDVDLGLSEETSSVVIPDTIANLPIVDISMEFNANNFIAKIVLNNSALKLKAYDVIALQKIKLNENIKAIELSGLQDLFDINLDNLPNLEDVNIEYCPSLPSLDFSNSILLNRIRLFNIEKLTNITFLNNDLNGLYIEGAYSLKSLDLGNTKFTPYTYNGLVYNTYLQLYLSELKELDISKISWDTSINSLITCCPLLTSFKTPEASLENNKFAYLEFIEGANMKLNDVPYFKNAEIDYLVLESTQESAVLNGLTLRSIQDNYRETSPTLNSITFEDCVFRNNSNFGKTTIRYINFRNCGTINLNTIFQGGRYLLEELHFEGNTSFTDITNPVFINNKFPNLTDIYFNGTEEEWNNIEKVPSNVKLFDGSVTIHFEE